MHYKKTPYTETLVPGMWAIVSGIARKITTVDHDRCIIEFTELTTVENDNTPLPNTLSPAAGVYKKVRLSPQWKVTTVNNGF